MANTTTTKKKTEPKKKTKLLEVVSDVSLNIRKEPSRDAEIIGTLKPKTKVALVKEVNDDWYEVNAKKIKGFVMSKYVNLLE